MSKIITKNKTVFKEYLRDPQIVWIYNEENFKKEAKKYQILENYKNIDEITLQLLKSDEFKFKRKILNSKPDPYDFPEPIIDGLEINLYSEKYFSKKYKHLKKIDLTFQMEEWKDKWPKGLETTKDLILNQDNWILFEGCFEYDGYKMRPDVLIKENGTFKLIEVKACSFPKEDHAYDLYYQYNILKALNFYDPSTWTINLCTLNKLFIKTNSEIEDSEIPIFKDDWILFFNSSPFSKTETNKYTKEKVKLSFEDSLKKSLQAENISNNYFLNFFKKLDSKYSFKKILNDIEVIQNQDEILISRIDEDELEQKRSLFLYNDDFELNAPINLNWKIFGGSYYLPYLMTKAGVPIESIKFSMIENLDSDDEDDENLGIMNVEINDIIKIIPKISTNSIFSLSGDSGFDFKKKALFFNLGLKTINDVPEYLLLSKTSSHNSRLNLNKFIKGKNFQEIALKDLDGFKSKPPLLISNDFKVISNFNESFKTEEFFCKKHYKNEIRNLYQKLKEQNVLDIKYEGKNGRNLFQAEYISKLTNYFYNNSQLSNFKNDNSIFDKPSDSIVEFLYNNHPKRLLQKYYLNSDKPFVQNSKISKYIEQYRNKTIYMYDFETVKNSVPRVLGTRCYEQIPFQFSLHIIENKKTYHYSWLASNDEKFYEEFWIAFANSMFNSKHNKGIYVSYNKAFEKTVIKNFLENPQYNHLIEVKEKMKIIFDETIDLMDPFSKRWYYHNSLGGSYSIKVVGKSFAPEANYEKLEKIKKGDQASKEAKFWVMRNSHFFKEFFHQHDSNYFTNRWNDIRQNMLDYCELDTKSMVLIYQNFLEKFL